MHEPSICRVTNLFGVEIQSVTRAGGGFSHATVFRVLSSDHRVYALRRIPLAASLPEHRLRGLHRLLSVVQDKGLTVIPVPLRPCRSASLQVKPTEDLHVEDAWIRWGEDVWQMEPWMPGESADGSLTDAQLVAALECLRAFHTAAQAAVSVMSPNEWFFVRWGKSPAAERRLRIAKELATGQLEDLKSAASSDTDMQFRSHALRICQIIETWLPWLTNRLGEVSVHHLPLQPVVRDLWRAHVLFTGNNVTGLIDLSAAASDHVVLDLSRLLRSWFRGNNSRICDAAEQFSAQRSLGAMEWTLLEALDASTVLLSPVTWLRRRYESGDQSTCRVDIVERMAELTETAECFRPLRSLC